MKGERRHELQHNALADYLAGIITAVKPYSNAILGSILLAIVAAGAYLWWTRGSAEKEMAGWDEFLVVKNRQNFDLFDLDGFDQRHEGTKVSFQVLAYVGDRRRIDGCRNLFISRVAANDDLDEAEKQYNAIREKCDDPALLLRATFGLAHVHEARGRLDDAEKLYEDIVKKSPKTAYGNQAKRRLEFLAQTDNRWFYDQFAEYDPTPKAPAFDPGILPFDPNSLLEPPGSGGSSLLDRPPLEGGTGDTFLLPNLGGSSDPTEPDDPGDDGGETTPGPEGTGNETPAAGTETDSAPPGPADPMPTPGTTEPATPDATEPADPGKAPADNGE